MADTVTVKLPNGEYRTATYRNEFSEAGFVRVGQLTVSGRILRSLGEFRFEPRGLNAYLVA